MPPVNQRGVGSRAPHDRARSPRSSSIGDGHLPGRRAGTRTSTTTTCTSVAVSPVCTAMCCAIRSRTCSATRSWRRRSRRRSARPPRRGSGHSDVRGRSTSRFRDPGAVGRRVGRRGDPPASQGERDARYRLGGQPGHGAHDPRGDAGAARRVEQHGRPAVPGQLPTWVITACSSPGGACTVSAVTCRTGDHRSSSWASVARQCGQPRWWPGSAGCAASATWESRSSTSTPQGRRPPFPEGGPDGPVLSAPGSPPSLQQDRQIAAGSVCPHLGGALADAGDAPDLCVRVPAEGGQHERGTLVQR